MTRPPLWAAGLLTAWIAALATQTSLWTAAYLNDAFLPLVSGHHLLHGLWPHLHIETPVGLPYALANAAALFLSGGNPVAIAWAPALFALAILPLVWIILTSRFSPATTAAATLLVTTAAALPVSLEAVFPTYLAWYNHASLSLLSVLLLASLTSPNSKATHSAIAEGLLLTLLWLLKPTAAVCAAIALPLAFLLRTLSPRHILYTITTAAGALLLLLPTGIPQAQITDLATALHATTLSSNAGAIDRLRLLLLTIGQNLLLLLLATGLLLLTPSRRQQTAAAAFLFILFLASTQNHGQWLTPWLLLTPLLTGLPARCLPIAPLAGALLALGQQTLLALTPPDTTTPRDPPAPWTASPAGTNFPLIALGARLAISPIERDRATPARRLPLDLEPAPDLQTPKIPLHALDEAWLLAQGNRLLRTHAQPHDRIRSPAFTNPWPWALGLPPVPEPLWIDPFRSFPQNRNPATLLEGASLLMVPTTPRSRFYLRTITPAAEHAACAQGWRIVDKTHGWRLLAPPDDPRAQHPCTFQSP